MARRLPQVRRVSARQEQQQQLLEPPSPSLGAPLGACSLTGALASGGGAPSLTDVAAAAANAAADAAAERSEGLLRRVEALEAASRSLATLVEEASAASRRALAASSSSRQLEANAQGYSLSDVASLRSLNERVAAVERSVRDGARAAEAAAHGGAHGGAPGSPSAGTMAAAAATSLVAVSAGVSATASAPATAPMVPTAALSALEGRLRGELRTELKAELRAELGASLRAELRAEMSAELAALAAGGAGGAAAGAGGAAAGGGVAHGLHIVAAAREEADEGSGLASPAPRVHTSIASVQSEVDQLRATLGRQLGALSDRLGAAERRDERTRAEASSTAGGGALGTALPAVQRTLGTHTDSLATLERALAEVKAQVGAFGGAHDGAGAVAHAAAREARAAAAEALRAGSSARDDAAAAVIALEVTERRVSDLAAAAAAGAAAAGAGAASTASAASASGGSSRRASNGGALATALGPGNEAADVLAVNVHGAEVAAAAKLTRLAQELEALKAGWSHTSLIVRTNSERLDALELAPREMRLPHGAERPPSANALALEPWNHPLDAEPPAAPPPATTALRRIGSGADSPTRRLDSPTALDGGRSTPSALQRSRRISRDVGPGAPSAAAGAAAGALPDVRLDLKMTRQVLTSEEMNLSKPLQILPKPSQTFPCTVPTLVDRSSPQRSRRRSSPPTGYTIGWSSCPSRCQHGPNMPTDRPPPAWPKNAHRSPPPAWPKSAHRAPFSRAPLSGPAVGAATGRRSRAAPEGLSCSPPTRRRPPPSHPQLRPIRPPPTLSLSLGRRRASRGARAPAAPRPRALGGVVQPTLGGGRQERRHAHRRRLAQAAAQDAAPDRRRALARA